MSNEGYYFSLMNSQENRTESQTSQSEVTLSVNNSTVNEKIVKKEESVPTPTLSSI